MGLKNIKIDTAEQTLTDTQKAVLEYFDDDYLDVPSYEFLRRYPGVFNGAQLTLWGSIKKVISMDADTYKVVLWLNIGEAEYEYPEDCVEFEGDYVVLTGKTGNTWYMEGDTLKVFGRYTGIETLDIDGVSYTIPAVSVYSGYYDRSGAPKEWYRYIQKFDVKFIKKVAAAIFGDDIEVRKPIADIDLPEWVLDMWAETTDEGDPCFVVELENQSNAKFSKFFFFTDTNADVWGSDRITVAKDATAVSGIERSIEFAADFSHFFLFTYDTDLETLTLEYYDSGLNKVWKREFDETTSAMYDYTKNNIYLCANNELYIINIETGEDTYPPAYVGAKKAVRKLDDGILMISESRSDGVMKAGLDGRLVWKTNLAENTFFVDGVQIVDNHIIFEQYSDELETHYIVLDQDTGSIIEDAVSLG